jgi:hypothetical protein
MVNIMKTYKNTLIELISKDIYLEDIYGNKATVYHRTRIKNIVDIIYDVGFKPGKGASYGKGFYSTYE